MTKKTRILNKGQESRILIVFFQSDQNL